MNTGLYCVFLISFAVSDAAFFQDVFSRTTSTVQPPPNIFGKFGQFGGGVLTRVFGGNKKFEKPPVSEHDNSVTERVGEVTTKRTTAGASTLTSTVTTLPTTTPETTELPVTDTTVAEVVEVSTAKKVVPVGDDGGRTVGDAPVRGCENGGRRDSKGNCRELF